MADCVDECPGDPNKHKAGQCGCRLPETEDTDGDGVSDCKDHCPDDQHKITAGECGAQTHHECTPML